MVVPTKHPAVQFAIISRQTNHNSHLGKPPLTKPYMRYIWKLNSFSEQYLEIWLPHRNLLSTRHPKTLASMARKKLRNQNSIPRAKKRYVATASLPPILLKARPFSPACRRWPVAKLMVSAGKETRLVSEAAYLVMESRPQATCSKGVRSWIEWLGSWHKWLQQRRAFDLTWFLCTTKCIVSSSQGDGRWMWFVTISRQTQIKTLMLLVDKETARFSGLICKSCGNVPVGT